MQTIKFRDYRQFLEDFARIYDTKVERMYKMHQGIFAQGSKFDNADEHVPIFYLNNLHNFMIEALRFWKMT